MLDNSYINSYMQALQKNCNKKENVNRYYRKEHK
jgi:hypothetical protein